MLRGVSWTDFGAGVFLFLIFFQLLTLILYGRITIEESNLPLLIVETVAMGAFTVYYWYVQLKESSGLCKHILFLFIS